MMRKNLINGFTFANDTPSAAQIEEEHDDWLRSSGLPTYADNDSDDDADAYLEDKASRLWEEAQEESPWIAAANADTRAHLIEGMFSSVMDADEISWTITHADAYTLAVRSACIDNNLDPDEVLPMNDDGSFPLGDVFPDGNFYFDISFRHYMNFAHGVLRIGKEDSHV